VDILYGDGASGDLLFFRDSLSTPRKLNIQRLLAGGYIGIQDTFLDVIKAPPVGLPKCTYENDTTVSANNLVNSIFNIALTHLYDDFEESVLGSGAVQPLPSDPFDPKNNTDKSRNARIAIYVPTGDQNVTKIRIYGKQTTNGVTTDWFVIDTLIKSDLGITNNTYYRYLFYNNGNYVTADPAFTVLDQDYVPPKAGSQALLNGNVIAYSNITEGFDFINPTFNITTGNTDAPVYALNGTLFFAAPNGLFTSGQPQITVYLTGVGVNDGFGNPTTLEKPPELMAVRAKSNGSDVGFQYLNVPDDISISDLLTNLQAAAVTAGWIVDSSTTNSFTVHYPTGTIVLQSSYLAGVGGDNSPYKSSVSALYPQSAYSYAVLYRDAGGRTNGDISNVTGNIKTQPQGTGTQIPIVTIDLSGFTPPPWAVYYEVCRTDTLTYFRHFDWVSNSAYSNTGQFVQQQYAYFGLSNVDYYNTQINATQGVVGYTQFTAGDRIKILGRYDINNVFTALNLDYAIVGLAVNPNINGIVKTGNFVQIAYPTADINANFAFDGTINFQNYKILIYSYKAQAATNQNVYFQTGQQYGIGNPGQVTAYHMGNIADNQVAITDGDVFFRPRTVPIVDSYFIPSIGYDQGSTWSTLRINVNGGGSVLDPTLLINNGLYEIKGGSNQAGGQGTHDYPSFADNDYTFRNLSSTITLTVRLKGTQPITDKNDPNGVFAMWLKVNTPTTPNNYNIIVNQPGMEKSVLHNFDFDATITVPPGGRLWLQNYMVNEMIAGGFSLELDVIRQQTINIFDTSFSDIYAIRTNSDNKPNVVDTTAKKTTFGTLLRFSQPDVLGTNINNSNRFYFNNFDEFSKEFGAVMKMRVRQRELRIFQYRRCGQVGIYQKFIRDNSGVNQLVTTDTIITPNNIRYFEGEYGIGNQPDSLLSSGYVDYFTDPVKGFICRLSLNGIEPISELYKVQTWAGANLPNYLSNYTYTYGGNSVILGAYNFNKDRDGEAMFVLQPGTSGPNTLIGEAFAFNERANSFTSFYDWNIDSIVCCENLLYFFKNGQLYSWDNQAATNNFFGTVYPATITIPFNDNLMEKKTFLAVAQVSNVPWICPSITTNQMSYGTTPQQSNLVAEDFAALESTWNASFWRDANSQKGQFNGDTLKGNLAVIQFQVTNPTQLVHLTDISVTYIDSRRTNR
jgi:hypothetical protein